MRVTTLFGLSAFLTFASIYAGKIENTELLETLKTSERWLILSPVEDSETTSKISSIAQGWLLEKENELQKLDLEVVTLSKKERRHAEKAWSTPFTTRLNKDLIQLCQSLETNLLTAYHEEKQQNLTYVVYSLSKKKQLVFRETVKTPPNNKIEVSAIPPSSSKSSVTTTSPVIKKETGFTELNFNEKLKNWMDSKGDISSTKELNSSKRLRRKSHHSSVKSDQQDKVHQYLINNSKLIAYAKEQKAKGTIETTCLEHLKNADKSWMSASKLEHLSRAYILNHTLTAPNQNLKTSLLKDIVERQNFLDDWNSDVEN